MACPSTQYYDDKTYLPEIWVWFGVGTLVTLLRLIIRLREVGLHRCQADDYLAVAVWLCFTGKSVALTMVFKHGSNMDYFTTEEVSRLETCQLAAVTLGSKMELIAWYTYGSIIWGLKGMVLSMFARFRLTLDRRWLFRFLVISTSITYAAMLLTISLGCLPFHKNWQVDPPPPSKCSLRMHDVYVSTVLNVVTDLLILAIPLPTLWTMRAKLGKKIGLALLLCSGLFVMMAAVIRLGFTLTGSTSSNLNKWCQRETTIGIITVNIPTLWSRLRSTLNKSPISRYPAANKRDVEKARTQHHEIPVPRRLGILTSSSDATKCLKSRTDAPKSMTSSTTLAVDRTYESSSMTWTGATSDSQTDAQAISPGDTLARSHLTAVSTL